MIFQKFCFPEFFKIFFKICLFHLKRRSAKNYHGICFQITSSSFFSIKSHMDHEFEFQGAPFPLIFLFFFSLYIYLKKKKLDLSKQELEEPQEIQNYPSWIILKQRQGRHLPLGRVSTYPLGDHVGVIQVRRKINKTCNFNIVLTNSNKYVKFTIHKLL